MRCTLTALALVGLAALASAAPAELSAFESFCSKNGESFKNAKDELIRAAEFVKHEKEVLSHNADPNATYQEGDDNENMDMTEKELIHDRLGFNASAISPSAAARGNDAVTSPTNGGGCSGALSTKGYNNGKYFGTGKVLFDWGDKMTPVKDQGKCGSCWAFSAMCVLEARLIIKKGLSRTLDLSEQQLVDCSKTYGNMGCNGGVPTWAFNYVKAQGKVAQEASYPYAQAEKAYCLAPTTGLVDVLFSTATSQNIVSIPFGSEAGLLEGLKTGPVCVCIGVNLNKAFFTYKSGVFRCTTKVGRSIDHAIVLVGATETTWIVRNSWGASWGVNGYGEIARGDGDMCGLASQSQYPLL